MGIVLSTASRLLYGNPEESDDIITNEYISYRLAFLKGIDDSIGARVCEAGIVDYISNCATDGVLEFIAKTLYESHLISEFIVGDIYFEFVMRRFELESFNANSTQNMVVSLSIGTRLDDHEREFVWEYESSTIWAISYFRDNFTQNELSSVIASHASHVLTLGFMSSERQKMELRRCTWVAAADILTQYKQNAREYALHGIVTPRGRHLLGSFTVPSLIDHD